MKWQYFVLVLNLLITFQDVRSFTTAISINYFTLRNIKFVCLLACGNPTTNQKIVRRFNSNSIAVGILDIKREPLIFEKVNLCLRQTYSDIGVLIDKGCNNVEKILYYASQKRYFGAQRKWLIFEQITPTADKQTIKYAKMNHDVTKYNYIIKSPIICIFENLNLSINSDVIVVIMKGSQEVTLLEVFNFGKLQGGKLSIKNLGQWNSKKGQNFNFLNEYTYYRRWNFKDLMLRMVIVMSPHQKNLNRNIMIGEKAMPEISVITRTSYMILNVISEIHNFGYQYTTVDRWIGKYLKNSTATVTNSLYFREQDISPIIRLLKSTSEHVDIINPPLTSIETKYYYKIPTRGPGKYENQFLRPLSTGTWLGVFAVCVMCAIVLALTSRFERRQASMQFAIFSVFASICQQFFEDSGEVAARRTTTGKLTILVTGASCVLIYNYYTSSVVSWLLNGPPPSINSLKELLESPLELIFEDIGYTRSWLQTDPKLQMPDYYYNKGNAKVEDDLRQKKVFNKNKGAPLLVPIERGIEMVKAGGYAYHTEVDSANNVISRTFSQNDLCELGSLQSMEKTLLYVCLQKDSPYKEFFTWSLLRLLNRGIVSRIQHQTRAPDVSCKDSTPRALALGGAAPAFILLGFGFALSFIVMILERIHNNIRPGMKGSVRNYLRY